MHGCVLPQIIFKISLQVPHDYLNLQVPVWVTSIGFVPQTGDRPCIAVGTGYHHVRCLMQHRNLLYQLHSLAYSLLTYTTTCDHMYTLRVLYVHVVEVI